MDLSSIITGVTSGGLIAAVLTYLVASKKNNNDFTLASIERSQAVNDTLIKNLNAEYNKLRERVAILEQENKELRGRLNN